MYKTRMEIWKDYREEIDKNIILKEALLSTNKEYESLLARVQRVFPTFKVEQQYDSKTETIELTNVKEYKNVDLSNIEKIMDFVETVNRDTFKDSFVDKLEFSSHILDDIFEMFEKREKTRLERVRNKTSGKTEEVQFIKLDKGGMKVNKKIRIAIDGPSGTGKTTVSRLLANRLDYNYISTGLVYRSFALIAFKNQIEFNDEKNLLQLIRKAKIELLKNEKVKIDGEDVTIDLRADTISQGASKCSVLTAIRKEALIIQRSYAVKPGIIMDGRDTAYNIMPQAELKIYLDTKPEVRASRRVGQNKELGFEIDYEQILSDIKERDHRDTSRAVDPLQIVEDAIYIDSTNMTENELLDHITGLVSNILSK